MTAVTRGASLRRVGIKDGESIIPVGPVAGSLFLGAGLLGMISATLTSRLADPLPDFRPGFVIAVSLVAALTGVITLRWGDTLPFWTIVFALLSSVLLVALGTYYSGNAFGPYASTFFVWTSLASGMFTTRPVILTSLVLTGIAEAVVLVAQTAPSPLSRWLLVVGTCVVTAATVDGVMNLLTRSMQAEHEALQELNTASRHKSEFLASMSHELRTPMNAIIGFSDVLAGQHFGELNQRQLDYVGDVQEAGRHLLSLINDILDLSKIESGTMELDPRIFSLHDTVESALNLIRTRAENSGVSLHTEIAGDAVEAYGDERRVKQVLANLLSNAVKFTPAGGSITVRAETAAGTTRVVVADTGIGIAAEDLARVFEDFQQAGDASLAAEGTGLGLALCRRLVELHGGTLTAESTLGEGSQFAFTLPPA